MAVAVLQLDVRVYMPKIVSFFFNDTATTEIYTLSLHDALPICTAAGRSRFPTAYRRHRLRPGAHSTAHSTSRSEEHTSELQSQSNLVCRLLLEKKKSIDKRHSRWQAQPG